MQYTDFALNHFRVKKIGEMYLLVSFVGSWDLLNKSEYMSLMHHKLDEELYERLLYKKIIVTDENLPRITKMYRDKKAQLFQGTSLHIIVATLRCNQKCIYCHARSKPADQLIYDMDADTAKKTVDFIFQSPSKALSIEFQGGEPLLNFKVIKEIILYARKNEKIKKKNLGISIVSNLSLMSDEILDFLIDNGITICTSLDGPKSLHDKNRPYASGSSYDLAVKWIKKIQKKTEHIHALVTVSKFSLPHWKEIIQEYEQIGLKSIWIRPLNNLGVANSVWKNISYTPEEYLSFWKKSVEFALMSDKLYERSSNLMFTKILKDKDPMFLDLMSPCGACIGQLAYNYDGNIYSCDEARMIDSDLFRIGNVFNNTYSEVLTSSKTKSLIACSVNENTACDNCIYQPFCGICPVVSFNKTGNPIPILPMDDRCKILLGQWEFIFDLILSKPELKSKILKLQNIKNHLF